MTDTPAEWSQKDEFWYKAPIGADVHVRVVAFGTWLRSIYSAFHRRMRMLEWLYEGSDLRRNAIALGALQDRGFTAAHLNVSESIVDTLVSRFSKDKPMPSMVVSDADWNLKRRAKQYRKFIVGEMLDTDFDEHSRDALLDSAVVGNGFTRIDDTGDGEKVFAERVLWDEILFDPRETKYGKPPNAFRVHRIARDRLAEIYPDKAVQIRVASPASARPNDDSDDDVTRTMNLEDYVDVFEAWHCGYGDDDGRHAVCIDNATLLSECWYEPRFPIATLRYKKSRRGLWTKGLMWKLKDVQHRINCIVRDLQMNLQAVGRGFFLQGERGAQPVESLTGWQPYTIKFKDGATPPQWTAPQPFNQAQLNALQFFIAQAHDLSGVSQAAAQSRSSLGPGASGVALDTQYDIESDRFAMQEAAYADYRLDSAQLYIDASKRVARRREENKGKKKSSAYFSSYFHRDAIQKLEYSKVELQGEDYKLRLESTNYLADSIAGKESAIGQLAQAGVIPQWLVAAIFDDADVERMKRITLGAFWNAERKMEDLTDLDAEMPAPAMYNDLDVELKMTVAYLNYYESDRAPEPVLERFRDYLDLVKDALKKRDMPPPGMPGAMPGPAQMPGAAPMLPPGAPMPPQQPPPIAA